MTPKVKFDPNDNDILVSRERRQLIDPSRLISLLPIMSHHWVADIGCGPGYFSIPFAKYLFDGKLFALDVQKEMLDATQKALKDARLTNTELILSKETKNELNCMKNAKIEFAHLGPRRLRSETAAITAISNLNQLMEL